MMIAPVKNLNTEYARYDHGNLQATSTRDQVAAILAAWHEDYDCADAYLRRVKAGYQIVLPTEGDYDTADLIACTHCGTVFGQIAGNVYDEDFCVECGR